jgi:hypothetical protein
MTSTAGTEYSDSGSYTTSGSSASLFSSALNATVGTATIMADGTITVTLGPDSFAPGTHTLQKQ